MRLDRLSRRTAPLLLLAAAACATPQPSEPPPLWLGADLSYVNEMEDCGAVFRKAGNPVDPFRLFAEEGANLVRVRIWNDAEWT